jgi:hypothetical protein
MVNAGNEVFSRRVIVLSMLRPSNSLLGSSRAARRANINAERRRWVVRFLLGTAGAVSELALSVFDMVVLCALPLVYLASSYLVLDLPARWLAHREPATTWTILLFFGALAVSIAGLVRLIQDQPPLAPVRPRFARTMLALGWVAALVFTVGDLVS